MFEDAVKIAKEYDNRLAELCEDFNKEMSQFPGFVPFHTNMLVMFDMDTVPEGFEHDFDYEECNLAYYRGVVDGMSITAVVPMEKDDG